MVNIIIGYISVVADSEGIQYVFGVDKEEQLYNE